MGLPAGRVLDLVASWCQRAQDGDAGELRLFVKDGEIAIEEAFRRPRPLYMGTGPGSGARMPRRGRGGEPEPELEQPWTAPTLEHTTPCRLKSCPRCGTGDLLWEPDRYVPGREPGAYGCLQCGATA